MLNRREFLGNVPAAAAFVRAASAQLQPKIRQVDIIHHTHTDVGYTELPAVVRDLQKRYLDLAVDTCKHQRSFRWTVESLLGLDDWWRASIATRRNELLDLVQSGQIDVMGLPFNQTPFLNAAQWRQMMAWIPGDLWHSLHIRVAMQNDVNGFPRAGAMALLDHGIHHLLMGLNPDSGGPPFRRPAAFWWKMPDGQRLFVWLGEHYGSAMAYLQAAWQGNHLLSDDEKVRAAQRDFTNRLRQIESEGYSYDRLILTFTHPLHYDNGAPFPSLAPFIEAWNRLGCEPPLRLVTATEAAFQMEKAVGSQIPELQGEWTDWWANGDASAPREVAASRRAKRHLAAANSPVFGPMPGSAQPLIEEILRDLCLFDEHTWGASRSISEPYSFETLGQFVEKSDLAYRPMGMAEALLTRRVRARLGGLPEGIYAINPAAVEFSGWASLTAPDPRIASIVDTKTGERIALRRGGGAVGFWLENLAPHSMRVFREDAATATDAASEKGLQVRLDSSGWPQAASWEGMPKPLFDGALGAFLSTGVVPPADRHTITQLHANPDPEKRAAIRKVSFRETAAEYEPASAEDTPHTQVYTQEILHPRLDRGRRRLELWRREPRARVSVQFDRLPSLAPEVFHVGFTLPGGSPMPVVSSGGVPFTPYRDQLPGSCKDYFAIDGWAHYATRDGHWVWVTRDAPLIAIGSPHVVERHQVEPPNPGRILAVVFDNCWHTNFVADSHGTFEFQFELVWKQSMANPADLAEALATEPMVLMNPTTHQTADELDDLYRR